MDETNVIEARIVKYFAVYPGGRRCEVTQQQALDHADKWKNEDDVRVITRVECVPMCVIGTVVRG